MSDAPLHAGLREASAPILTSLILLLIYLMTLAPGLAGGDTPEMITAAYTVGIPHQPGYPLYVLMGRVLTFMPLGPIAVRVTLLSALAGAVAAGVLTTLLRRSGLGSPAASALAIGAGLSWMTWSVAVVAEVYTLALALGLIALMLVDLWRRRGEVRTLMAAAYTGALAVSHQPLAGLLIPGVLIVLVPRLRDGRLAPRHALAALALFALPFTLFALLPLRSADGAVIDYAQIGDTGDFVYHALGVASGSELLSEGAEGVLGTLRLFASVGRGAMGALTPLVVLLALAGLFIAGRTDRERFALLGLPVPIMLAFAIVYAILDVENYLVLPFWLLVAAAGDGLARLSSRSAWASRAAPVIAIGIAASAFLANRARCDRSSYHLVDDFVTNSLACVPERGALFLYTEVLAGPFAYHVHVEGRRGDVELVDMTGKVLPADYGFREITGDWREGRWRRMEALQAEPPPSLGGRRFTSLMDEPRQATERGATYRRRGLLFELAPAGAGDLDRDVPSFDELRIRMPDPALVRADRTAFSLTPRILAFYAAAAEAEGRSYLSRGDLDAAVRLFRQMLDFAPRSLPAREALALAYVRQGRPDAARAQLERAIAIQPAATQALNALGVLELQQGERQSAEARFRRALEADRALALTHLNLGMLLAQDPVRAEEGALHLQTFIHLAPEDPGVGHAREMLARLGRGEGGS